MKSIGKLGGFDVWIRSRGGAQRCPVQFEKTKTVLAESAIYLFSVSFFKPRTAPLASPPALRAGGDARGAVLGTGFDVLPDAPENPATAMSNLAAWSAQKFAVSIRGVPGSIPPFYPAVWTDL